MNNNGPDGSGVAISIYTVRQFKILYDQNPHDGFLLYTMHYLPIFLDRST